MRSAFIRTLVELAGADPRIVLLTGDLGFMALEPFAERYKGRFFNAGVAEQNMTGLATGLAEAGFIPFIYSIAAFAALRPYEFIRNGPILHRFPVRIIGVGGGFEYGYNGITHYGLEDIAVMRVQPGITVIAPADYQQARQALLKTWDLAGPVYYRLGKDDQVLVNGLNGEFELGRAQFISKGRDVLIVAMGSITVEASELVELLKKQGISSALAVVASISPAPVNDLAEALSRFCLAVTVEAHYISGGLGSLVSEIAAERGLSCKVIRCGVREPADGISGKQSFLHKRHKLDSSALAGLIRGELKG